MERPLDGSPPDANSLKVTKRYVVEAPGIEPEPISAKPHDYLGFSALSAA
jgi:hypothetical protein